jgi:CBS-domain-containing membrane protein
MANAGLLEKAKRVRIYVSEGDLYRHRPIDVALVAMLRKEGASGVTVFRGVEGFGGSGVVHTARLVDVRQRLPILIEWIDRSERVEQLLPRVSEMLEHGLITVDETSVAFFRPSPVRDVPAALRASDVMSREVVTVTAETPVRKVVELMVGQSWRAIPVVESGHPIGIITNSDLLERGGLSVRVDLLPLLGSPELKAELDRLSKGAKSAGEVMTHYPVIIGEELPLTQAAELMALRRLKRLPVVDERGMLVGMLSRLDVLRTAAGTLEKPAAEPREVGLAADASISSAMRRDVPTVFPETPLPQVLQAVISTRLNRCVVVDHERHVLGAVTDAELLDRVTPAMRPSTLSSLMHRLPFAHPSQEGLEVERRANAKTADELMVEVVMVGEQAPLREAIAAMLPGKHKIVAVVDEEKRLVGILDRADLLRGLTGEKSES